MGDFRKNVLQADFGRKKACKEILGKNISLITYNDENKSYTVISQGKKF